MNVKYLRIIIYLTGALSLYVFLAARSFPLMNAILSEKMDQETQGFYKYGELYYFSCISDFKVAFNEQYPKYRLSDQNPRIDEADILTYGDSFIDLPFQKNVPELLSDSLDRSVFTFAIRDPLNSNPFCLLNDGDYQYNNRPKVFIYESVERSIPVKFSEQFNNSCDKLKAKNNSLKNEILQFVFKKNTENVYTVMLKQSYFTSKIYSLISTIKFRLFGYISPLTPVYVTEPDPWIFHEYETTKELGGFYYQYTDQEIQNYADNILYLKNELKRLYNFDFVFLPVPTKYTIYHKVINNHPYNNFLPRLYKEMDSRGIAYVDLFTEYSKSTEILYHGTDTHWNKKGVDIAMKKLLHVIPATVNNQIGYVH